MESIYVPPMPYANESSTSSSSSSDENETLDTLNFINHRTAPRKDRVYRTRENHFQKWDEGEFYDRFRLSKNAAFVVLEEIREKIQWTTTRNKALMPCNMLLLTLRFLATNNFLISAGDFIGIHKSTAGRHIWRVLQAIAKLRTKYINMPTGADKNQVQRNFYLLAKFPNVIGALDCTHIKIESPGGSQAETFRCRKQFFSLNVQAICSADLIIQDIVARWPGSAHDSRIFQNSRIKERFEGGEFGDGILVGDSGYAVTRYCMIPLANTSTAAEELYNESQIRTRNPIERTFGVMKRRFPILSLGMRLSLSKVQYVCVVCAILHNIAVQMHNSVLPRVEPEVELAILNTADVPVRPFSEVRSSTVSHNLPRQAYINYFDSLL